VKKFWGLLVLVMALLSLCSALGEEDLPTDTLRYFPDAYPKAAAGRLGITSPKGIVFKDSDDQYTDGLIKVVVDTASTDWESVMVHGGYPYVRIRPYVKNPDTSKYETCLAFNGGIFDISMNDFFVDFASELNRDSFFEGYNPDGWYREKHDNGCDIGEIVADQCMLIPRAHSGGGGGYFIAWVDLDAFKAAYQADYPNGKRNFTTDEIKKNEHDIFYFEYVELDIGMDMQEPFYVPFKSLSAASMSPTENYSKLPDGVSVLDIENGDITYQYAGSKEREYLPLVLNVPADATKLEILNPNGADSTHTFENLTPGGTVVFSQDYWVKGTIEEQYVAIWYDSAGNALSFGVFFLHCEPETYKPWPWYVKEWSAPEESRIEITNTCSNIGVTHTYDASIGNIHVGYDKDITVSGELGIVSCSVEAPTGAKAFRMNHSGGNNIMGQRDEASKQHDIMVGRTDVEVVPDSGFVTLYDERTPLRHYQAGPVDVYIQMDAIWPYGGGVYLIYWYKSVEDATNHADTPMDIEYVVDTTGTICITSRTEIVESESAITGRPVDKVTCVSPKHHGRDWHLVIHRHPQKGHNACHWELYLENERGDYEPLDSETTFYMPYPDGHSYDHEHDCARDSNGNKATYEIYHYNANYNDCDTVTAIPTEYGIKFVVKSLSPFVLDWGDFQGDLTPDQGGEGDGNEGDHEGDGGGNEGDGPSVNPEWPLQRLDLRRGTSDIRGVRVKDLSVSTRGLTTIDKCTIENLAIEFSSKENRGLNISRSNISMLFMIINRDTPLALDKPAAVIGADNSLKIIFITIPHPNEENPDENEWPGEITKPLITFEGERTIELLILEGNWQAFNPIWLDGNVTIKDVDWPDNPTGQPVPYETFLQELGRN